MCQVRLAERSQDSVQYCAALGGQGGPLSHLPTLLLLPPATRNCTPHYVGRELGHGPYLHTVHRAYRDVYDPALLLIV